ncbi:RidA family protein [Amycolatopsis rubida]|uniref:RidA family protein n=1 Tax=Amycolatopsis rubida TaxID=112413 RepID=UPI000B83B9D8|nr:RidA family protein [Amycolatopsis rubida]
MEQVSVCSKPEELNPFDLVLHGYSLLRRRLGTRGPIRHPALTGDATPCRIRPRILRASSDPSGPGSCEHPTMPETNFDVRLRALGLALPTIEPKGSYVPGRISGNLLHVSGQGPFGDDGTVAPGVVGHDVTVERATSLARLTGVRLLGEVKNVCGSLNEVSAVVRLFGTIRSAPEFEDHVEVMNGCSELMLEVFGEKVGAHARMVVGVSSLPFGMPIEISAIFRLREHD